MLLFAAFAGSAVRWLGVALTTDGTLLVLLSVFYGLTYGVFCSEWTPFQPQSQIVTDGLAAFPAYPKTVLSQTPQLPFASEDCAIWDVPKAQEFIKDVTISSIPTLVINGAFDGKTSPMWATYVAKNLRNATTIIIPGIGHFVTPQSPCAQTVVREFLADPTTPPDTSCVASVTIPLFLIKNSTF